ncbi:MAG: RNA polymerase sigma factor [Candidatus Liptonbacteria bacterium]|nr:RNA polymerase sigma factor [Candidatus Liptonbacteria bacterium]
MKGRIFITDKLSRLAMRMKKGDSRAADTLHRELVEKVYGFCVNRLHRRDYAEDLTQEIFLKLVTKIDLFDPSRGNFAVWFWQLARNTVTDHFRHKREYAFSDVGEMAQVEAIATHNPERQYEDALETKHLNEFMKTLDEYEQELFRLRYVAELSYGEISAILEKSEGALRVAVNRLKKKIQKQFA